MLSVEHYRFICKGCNDAFDCDSVHASDGGWICKACKNTVTCSTCPATIPDTAKGWCPECAEYRDRVVEAVARAIHSKIYGAGKFEEYWSGEFPYVKQMLEGMASAALYEIEKHYDQKRKGL